MRGLGRQRDLRLSPKLLWKNSTPKSKDLRRGRAIWIQGEVDGSKVKKKILKKISIYMRTRVFVIRIDTYIIYVYILCV